MELPSRSISSTKSSWLSWPGNRLPVTIIEAGPCVVVQVKTRERDGYDALQLGFGDIRPKLVSMPRKGHFTAHGVEPTRLLREIRLEEPLPKPKLKPK